MVNKLKEDEWIIIFGGKSGVTMQDIYGFMHTDDQRIHLESDLEMIEEHDEFENSLGVWINDAYYFLGKHHIHINMNGRWRILM